MEKFKIMDFDNTKRNNFIGHNGFVWWIGVVENRLDPLDAGRYQVRIKGLHSSDNVNIPSESLPWAQAMFPVNQAGSTPGTLKEGDMVVGFFMDGDSAQFPIIMGMFHGIPEDQPDQSSGFNDQRSPDKLSKAPRKPKSIKYNTDGSGATIIDNIMGVNYPELLNEPTIDRLARNENIDKTIVKSKQSSVVTVKNAKGKSWKEPETPYNAKYPYNQVLATESGHYMEFDDTPASERIHVYHRSGTFTEIHPDGSKVDKITKNKYSIVMKDDNVFIMGDCSITVQGNAQVYVMKDCELKVDGNMNKTIGKDLNTTVNGNMTVKVNGNIDQTSIGDTTITGNSITIKEG